MNKITSKLIEDVVGNRRSYQILAENETNHILQYLTGICEQRISFIKGNEIILEEFDYVGFIDDKISIPRSCTFLEENLVS